MSSYFDALMRASGLSAADARPPEVSLLPVFESTPLAVGAEVDPIASDALPVRPGPRPSVPPFVPQDPQPGPAATATAEEHAQAWPMPSSRARAIDVQESHAARQEQSSPEDAPAESAAAAGDARLLAALRWVRADPHLARSEEAPEQRVRAIDVADAAPAAAIPTTIPRTIAHDHPAASIPAAQAFAFDSSDSPARSEAHAGLSSHAHEAVEVSIGAIHVRVDAPSRPAVAAASQPAPLPKARAGTAHAEPRSALGRRALRRI